jgi:hypothetical protein
MSRARFILYEALRYIADGFYLVGDGLLWLAGRVER